MRAGDFQGVLAGAVVGLAAVGCGAEGSGGAGSPHPEGTEPFDCTEVHLSTRGGLDAAAAAKCTEVGWLSVSGKELEDLLGLEDIEHVSFLDVDGVALRSLEGLSGLRTANRIIIDGAQGLETLRGLDGLEQVRDFFQIRRTGLGNLDGLGSLRHAHLRLTENRLLTSLAGLGTEFNHLDNQLSVHESPIRTLTDLRQLHAIGQLSLDGLRITSLDGLQSLRSVGQGVDIRFNEDLESLRGLDSLREVPWLTAYYNDALTDLSGIAKLERAQELTISQNHALESLGPLHEWPQGTVWGMIKIHYNSQLPQCEVMRFFEAQKPVQAECTHDCAGNAEASCD